MSKNNKRLDIISSISEDIIDICTAQRAKLRAGLVAVKTKSKRLRNTMIAAACLVLILVSGLSVFLLGNWNAPIYRGMSVSGSSPFMDAPTSRLDVLSRDFDIYDMIAHTSGMDVLDKDKDKDKDKNNTTTTQDYHDFDPSAQKELYYANQNEDFYITVHIENPKKFEIVSFTLNGEKYSSYMFEQGSDMENLVFKCNAGDATGIVEYTIDAIKYIDGTVIKDVIIGGDQTVSVGIYDNYTPTASASVTPSYTEAAVKITLIDSKGVISERGGKLFAKLYQDNKEIYTSNELSLEGENEIKFEKLEDNTQYEIKVIASYDSFDGQGLTDHVLRETKFTTKKLVEISASHPEQAKDFIKVNVTVKDPEGCVTKNLVELIDTSDNKVVKTLDHTGECVFDSLEVLKVFEIRISCTYAMPDGNGERTAVHSLSALTQSAGLEISYPTDPSQAPIVTGIGSCTDTELYINMNVDTNAFYGNTTIQRITLGEKAERINTGAFVNCTALKSAFFKSTSETFNSTQPYFAYESFDVSCTLFFATSFPNNIFIRPEGAYFFNCKEIITDGNGFTIAVLKNGSRTLADYEGKESNVTVPDGITAIGRNAFEYSSSLQSIIIPEGVKTIEDMAFRGCSKLQSVTLPDSLTTIGMAAFESCTGINELNLPDSLVLIDIYAFRECDSLKSISLPDSLKSIGSSTFSGCDNLESVTLPDSLTSIGDNAFFDCVNLKSIAFPDSLTRIGASAFRNCTNIKSLILPDSLTSIGSDAFRRCDNNYVFIPEGVLTIGSNAFGGKTTVIAASAAQMPSSWDRNFADPEFNTVIWDCDKIVTDDQGFTYVLKNDGSIIILSYEGNAAKIPLPENTVEIAPYAFFDCQSLKELIMPEGVTSIGDSAFENCYELRSINLPDSLTTIEGSAFYACSSIKYVFIPKGVRTIGPNAFGGTPTVIAVSAAQMPSSWDNDFANPELVIWDSDKIITDDRGFTYVLKNDGSIVILSYEGNASKITLPENTVEIAPRAFYECQSLEELIIPEGVTRIGESAFGCCYLLSSINLPDSLTRIGNDAFSYCQSLESISFSDGLEYIGDGAFDECTSLREIILPDSLTFVGSNAFYSCYMAERIYIPDSVNTIGGYAFHGCSTAAFYVEFSSRPYGWDSNWIGDYALEKQVIWGYSG